MKLPNFSTVYSYHVIKINNLQLEIAVLSIHKSIAMRDTHIYKSFLYNYDETNKIGNMCIKISNIYNLTLPQL